MNNIAQFRRDLPHAEVVLLHDTDHYFFEDPKLKDSIIKTVRNFLTQKG